MHKTTISLFCLLLASASVAAQSTPNVDFISSGNAFLRICEPADGKSLVSHVACMAYVVGVSDGAEMMSERFHERAYCPGPDVENEQKYRVVVKYAKDHPEGGNLQTRVLVMDALSAAFPCHPAK